MGICVNLLVLKVEPECLLVSVSGALNLQPLAGFSVVEDIPQFLDPGTFLDVERGAHDVPVEDLADAAVGQRRAKCVTALGQVNVGKVGNLTNRY